MELGSAEHKQKLIHGILKVALKTATLGFILGTMLIVPSLLRENTFSIGLAYGGYALVIGSLGYAGWIAWKKYQRIIKPFNDTFQTQEK